MLLQGMAKCLGAKEGEQDVIGEKTNWKRNNLESYFGFVMILFKDTS